ncbi:hypothetical protein yc1106_05953 [Curvularia clavata]|uniref:Major facilitator superfamily (MFS) profile domain-containing protein n=1 Tax=Curvularia clavata TaxID=95742 RepID=A0A9Q8ZBZ6_CURCL|nr:hypothetical protein yc1106_05953 [Curvularia clavata]
MPDNQVYELTEAPASRATASAMSTDEPQDAQPINLRLHKRTLLKLDCLLLPFLALFFLFNALDKTNIGNAESAHFTEDVGLDKDALNTAVALFFAFFVGLQPLGAALGRRYGMVLWVPSCMLLWGMCTALHAWVRARWQLYTLRILIGALEAGFYPVTVTYLSLFYTRFEFGRRLSFFYGQAAVGGALGGLLSYLVFSRFGADRQDTKTGYKPWQVLFLLEGCLTVIIAVIGYFWLPHSADKAWFLAPEERRYACSRVIQDRDLQSEPDKAQKDDAETDAVYDDESRNLLHPSRRSSAAGVQAQQLVDDRGLTPQDVVSAIFNTKIWHILACNILSAVPVYAFSVFLPLVLAPLTENKDPALVNLLTAPPHLCGAVTLYVFATYSDKHRIRLIPVFIGLLIMVLGLVLVVLFPASWAIPRYLALNVLLSGTYVASPLTVAWISGNTPSPGKRALLLGINGWGNLAGVISAMLFKPKYAESGYIVPFWWTLLCVALSAVGYVLFYRRIKMENKARSMIMREWTEEEIEVERTEGSGSFPPHNQWLRRVIAVTKPIRQLDGLTSWLEEAAKPNREGDDKITPAPNRLPENYQSTYRGSKAPPEFRPYLNTTATIRNVTHLPQSITYAQAVEQLHNHELLIRLDPEYVSHETVPSDPATPETKIYKITDHMNALPAGLWDTTVKFEAHMTDLDDGIRWLIKAPLGLVQKTTWKCLKTESLGDEHKKTTDEHGEWSLVEDVEITANRMLVSTVKGKCEANWRGTHSRFLEQLKAAAAAA